MRNFYTALDYDNNLIWMGVNKGSSDIAKAIISGHVSNPFAKKSKALSVVWQIVIVVFVIIFIAAVGIFVYQNRKLDKRTIKFDKINSPK